jgi:arabinogalactan endo-1,4-beta-galactosidase
MSGVSQFAVAVCLRHFATVRCLALFAGLFGFVIEVPAQYIVGADTSYLKQAQDAGTVFKDNGVPTPALQILKDHGYNWVRLRIFVHPTTLASNQDYTIASAKMAKELGYKTLLDFHYSDTWADPGKQVIPTEWASLNHDQLVNKVFTYTRDTVAAFRDAGVLPDMVQIGNEITRGMLRPDGQLPDNWKNFTDILKAGINGVDAGHGNQPRPLIMIHIDRGGDWTRTKDFFDHLLANDVRFDIIGQSYHPWWQGSLDDLRNNLYWTAVTYHKPIVLAEVSYPWKPFDKQNDHPPFPLTPHGQADWLRELNQVVEQTPEHLGAGLFWWEPAIRLIQPLHGRDLFDDNGNALPAMNVFDATTRK